MEEGRVKTLRERCSAIELLIVDVDGVLTAGGIAYGDPELEIKEFHVRDGSSLHRWHRVGKRTGLITGRSSPVVARRAAELAIDFVKQGAAEKLPAYRQLLAEAGVADEAVCYLGDDMPDLPSLRVCELAVAVADACAEVRVAAQYITQMLGGRGAVRETIELILRCQGRWMN